MENDVEKLKQMVRDRDAMIEKLNEETIHLREHLMNKSNKISELYVELSVRSDLIKKLHTALSSAPSTPIVEIALKALAEWEKTR